MACSQKQVTPLVFDFYCPAPKAPMLPKIIGEIFLDSRENIEILMLRDDRIRGYIQGLQESIYCYEQTFSKNRGREDKKE